MGAKVVNMALSAYDISVLLMFFFMIILCCSNVRADNPSKTTEFDVKPGGEEQHFEEHMGKFYCKFDYAAQGGTKEQWTMTLTKSSEGTEFTCTVERPGGRSYLFFQQFKIQIHGAKLQEVNMESQPRLQMPNQEYDVDYDDNYVATTSHFISQFCKGQIFARRFRGGEL